MVYLTTKCGKNSKYTRFDQTKNKQKNFKRKTKDLINARFSNIQAKRNMKVTKTEKWFSDLHFIIYFSFSVFCRT